MCHSLVIRAIPLDPEAPVEVTTAGTFHSARMYERVGRVTWRRQGRHRRQSLNSGTEAKQYLLAAKLGQIVYTRYSMAVLTGCLLNHRAGEMPFRTGGQNGVQRRRRRRPDHLLQHDATSNRRQAAAAASGLERWGGSIKWGLGGALMAAAKFDGTRWTQYWGS